MASWVKPLIWGSHRVLCSMVEWTEFETSAETSVSPGATLAKYIQFSWKANRAGLPAPQSWWDLLVYSEINQ